MSNQIFVVVKRTKAGDTEEAYRDTQELAQKEADARSTFDPKNIYLVIPKKVFGLNPDE